MGDSASVEMQRTNAEQSTYEDAIYPKNVADAEYSFGSKSTDTSPGPTYDVVTIPQSEYSSGRPPIDASRTYDLLPKEENGSRGVTPIGTTPTRVTTTTQGQSPTHCTRNYRIPCITLSHIFAFLLGCLTMWTICKSRFHLFRSNELMLIHNALLVNVVELTCGRNSTPGTHKAEEVYDVHRAAGSLAAGERWTRQ